MRRAFAVGPDLIYFLSDGDYTDIENDLERELQRLNPRKEVCITTIGFHPPRPEGGRPELLQRIAQWHNGHFGLWRSSDASRNRAANDDLTARSWRPSGRAACRRAGRRRCRRGQADGRRGHGPRTQGRQPGYKLSSGREVDRPIEQVKYLQITGWDAFNEAEKLRQAGNWRGGATVREDPCRHWAATDRQAGSRRCWCVVAWSAAYDEEGLFDKAVVTTSMSWTACRRW